MKRLFVLLLLVPAIGLADDDCKGHSCTGAEVDIVSTLSGGDSNSSSSVSVGGSRGYAFGGASFDVDIAQCLASRSDQILFGLWAKQRIQQNLHCMGLAYLAAGMYDAGKHILCDLKDSPLAGMPNCPGLIVEDAPPPPPPVEDTHLEEIEDQAEQIATQMAMITELNEKYEALAKRPSKTVQRTVVESTPLLTREQAEALKVYK